MLAACQPGGLLGSDDPTPLQGERISVFDPLSLPGLEEPLRVALPTEQVNHHWPLRLMTDDSPWQGGHLSLPEDLKVAWTRQTSIASTRRPMLVSPIVSDGVIYTLDASYELLALQLNDGQLLWSISLLDQQNFPTDSLDLSGSKSDHYRGGGITLQDGVLYVTVGWGYALAVSRQTGRILWTQRLLGPSRQPPLVTPSTLYTNETRQPAEPIVIVQTVGGSLEGLSSLDGRRVWIRRLLVGNKRLLDQPRMIINASRTAPPNLLVPLPRGELTAYNIQTGEPVWSQVILRAARGDGLGGLADFSSSPLIINQQLLLGSNTGVLASLNSQQGTIDWRIELPSPLTPWAAGEMLFVVSGSGLLSAVRRRDGRLVWSQDLPRTQATKTSQTWNPPILAGQRLLLFAREGAVLEISAKDGSILSNRFDNTLYPLQPLVVDQHLITLDAFGLITVYSNSDDRSDPPADEITQSSNPSD